MKRRNRLRWRYSSLGRQAIGSFRLCQFSASLEMDVSFIDYLSPSTDGRASLRSRLQSSTVGRGNVLTPSAPMRLASEQAPSYAAAWRRRLRGVGAPIAPAHQESQ